MAQVLSEIHPHACMLHPRPIFKVWLYCVHWIQLFRTIFQSGLWSMIYCIMILICLEKNGFGMVKMVCLSLATHLGTGQNLISSSFSFRLCCSRHFTTIEFFSTCPRAPAVFLRLRSPRVWDGATSFPGLVPQVPSQLNFSQHAPGPQQCSCDCARHAFETEQRSAQGLSLKCLPATPSIPSLSLRSLMYAANVRYAAARRCFPYSFWLLGPVRRPLGDDPDLMPCPPLP